MATSKGHRIGIIIIAVTMVVSTIAMFVSMILVNENNTRDQKKQQADYEKLIKEYQEEQEKQLKAQKEEAAKLSSRYFDDFSQFASLPEPFDESKATSLETEDLRVGEGAEIDANNKYRAYYIGWNTEGKVFDSSIEGDTLKMPLEGSNQMIAGWVQGVQGMRIGGVRVITIPGSMAYDADQGADIKANKPLRFVVMAIEPAAAEAEEKE